MTTALLVPLADIDVPRDWNLRSGDWQSDPEFADLCAAIEASGGNKTPIELRPVQSWHGERYEVVTGFRRMAALSKLGIKEALAIVNEMSDVDARIRNVSENIRENIKPADLAWAFNELSSAGLGPTEISKRVGLAAPYVGNLISLAKNLAPKIMTEWRTSQISVPYTAVLNLRDMSELEQEVAWKEILIGKKERGDRRGQFSKPKGRVRRLGEHLGKLARFGFITVKPDANWGEMLTILFPPNENAESHVRFTAEFEEAYHSEFRKTSIENGE
jgi:ParB/RepB/Spo0J family partition protein